MRRNKPGLADLKALRNRSQGTEPPPAPGKPERVARKRSPFLPPSQQRSTGPTTAVPTGTTGTGPTTVAPTGTPGAGSSSEPAPRPPFTNTATPPGSMLDEADRRLFRYAVRHVDKMKDPGRVVLPPLAPAAAAILAERRRLAAGLDDAASARLSDAEGANGAPKAGRRPLSDSYTPADSHHDDTRHLKPGHGTDILRDLRRGKWTIGASLDLHGSTVEEARERFDRFLSSCVTHEVKCVRIVHGKGYGSKDGDAVLKTTVRRWLTQVGEVIAYVECPEADGGCGAVQVLLK